MPELSLIIPVMNEEANIASLSKRIADALQGLDYELIWVNDGSTDDTTEMIRKYADKFTRLIELDRNYGQSEALQAGFWEAEGSYIATLDGDGQNDPLDILQMLDLIKNNDLDMVAGIRADRKDHFIRTFTSRVANALIRMVTRTDLKDLGCSTRIMKKEIAMTIPLKKGMHRFINVLVAKHGGRILQIAVNHSPRTAGKTKYGLSRIIPVLIDLVKICVHKNQHSPYTRKHFKTSIQS